MGVAIVTRRSLKSHTIYVQGPNPYIQVLHLKICNCVEIQNVIAIYYPSSAATSQCDWDWDLSQLKSQMLGDMNSHHTNWSYKTNSRGKQIYDSFCRPQSRNAKRWKSHFA